MRKAKLLLLTVSAAALSNGSGKRPFTRHDKAYYTDPAQVNFVRPGLLIKITGATVGPDGLITANFTATDPKGLALDLQGITTPGSITTSFVAAYIPKGGGNWLTLTTRPQKSPINGQHRQSAGRRQRRNHNHGGQCVHLQVSDANPGEYDVGFLHFGSIKSVCRRMAKMQTCIHWQAAHSGVSVE